MFRFVNVLMASPLVYRRVARNQLKQMLGSPKRWLAVWGRMQPADGAFFEVNPEAAGDIVIEMTEAVREGIDGVVHEAGLCYRDWGFDLRGIVTPTHAWHGLRDRQAAHTWAENLAANTWCVPHVRRERRTLLDIGRPGSRQHRLLIRDP